MKPHNAAYKLARLLNNADAILHPKRLPTRVKNIVVGRLLARTGIWKPWR